MAGGDLVKDLLPRIALRVQDLEWWWLASSKQLQECLQDNDGVNKLMVAACP